jgi:hypothetical protein
VSTIFKIVPKGSHRSYKKIKISKDGTIPPGAKVRNKLKKKKEQDKGLLPLLWPGYFTGVQNG